MGGQGQINKKFGAWARGMDEWKMIDSGRVKPQIPLRSNNSLWMRIDGELVHGMEH